MTHELSVLVVEDDQNEVALLLQLLEAGGFEPFHHVVADREAMELAMREWKFDVVISDYELPGFGGLQVLALAAELLPDTPVILFCDAVGEAAAVAAIKAGAADCVLKDRPTHLAPAIARELCDAEARRKQREAERALSEELERHVRELEEANRYLREVDRHKDEFLAVVSHELRTPLTVVIGYADLLARGVAGELTPRQAEVSGHIARSARKLQDLIQDLLEYAELQAGRIELSFEPTDPADLADGLAREFKPLAERKGITLTMATQGHHTPRLDGQRVRAVLRHLVGNALKFTPEGGRVDVRLTVTSHELAAEVVDTGVGIAPELQACVFDGFRQADMSNTRQAGGLGLGLGLARALVAALGGTIGVRSTPGEGSTFWFCLPVKGIETRPAEEWPESSRKMPRREG